MSIMPIRRARVRGQMNKIVSACEAVRLIRSGNTVAIGCFGGVSIAEELTLLLGRP